MPCEIRQDDRVYQPTAGKTCLKDKFHRGSISQTQSSTISCMSTLFHIKTHSARYFWTLIYNVVCTKLSAFVRMTWYMLRGLLPLRRSREEVSACICGHVRHVSIWSCYVHLHGAASSGGSKTPSAGNTPNGATLSGVPAPPPAGHPSARLLSHTEYRT